MAKEYLILENKNYYQYSSDGRFRKPKNKDRKYLKRRIRRVMKQSAFEFRV